MSETTLHKTSPSQWLNIWNFLVVATITIGSIIGSFFYPLIAIAILPALIWALWKWLVVRCEHYELTTQRIRITKGVLNQHIDEIELYRVKDITMTRLFWMRILGLSTIHLKTSDRTLPTLNIPAITKGDIFRELLREQVELVRDKKRVREMDFADTSDGADLADGMDEVDFE